MTEEKFAYFDGSYTGLRKRVEVKRPAKAVLVALKCPVCPEGEMVFTGQYTIEGGGRYHQCTATACRHIFAIVAGPYPMVRHEFDEDAVVDCIAGSGGTVDLKPADPSISGVSTSTTKET